MREIIPMDIQSEKLELIRWLSQLKDAKLIQKIKRLRTESFIVSYEKGLKPMSELSLRKRAERSEEDIAKGNISTLDELEREMKLWSGE